MARLGTRTLAGSSGTGYEFNIYAANQQFNDFIPGVFVLCKDDGGDPVIVYVGESDNVDRSLTDHEQQAEFDKHGANRICFHRAANPEKRKAAFDDLKDALSPLCS